VDFAAPCTTRWLCEHNTVASCAQSGVSCEKQSYYACKLQLSCRLQKFCASTMVFSAKAAVSCAKCSNFECNTTTSFAICNYFACNMQLLHYFVCNMRLLRVQYTTTSCEKDSRFKCTTKWFHVENTTILRGNNKVKSCVKHNVVSCKTKSFPRKIQWFRVTYSGFARNIEWFTVVSRVKYSGFAGYQCRSNLRAIKRGPTVRSLLRIEL
jgi:hypothetical protein